MIVKIKIINPNTSESMTERIRISAEAYAGKDTEIIAVNSSWGPESIETYYDEFLAIPGTLKEISKEDGADAYILACFSDPGLEAARELTDKPVLGIAEAAISLSKFIAPNFSIITILDRSKHMNKDLLKKYEELNRCVSIRATNLRVLDFDSDKEKGIEALVNESKKAVREDRAESIILGCAGFSDYVEEIQKRIEVPVIDGVRSALKFAEMLVDLGVKNSKIRTWSYPEEKNIIGFF